MGNYYGFIHSGTFGAWNTKATKMCDLGYTGLRDWGDYEQADSVEFVVNRAASEQDTHPEEVRRKLTFANAIYENLIAAVLVRSRLRQQDPDYHYKNSEAIGETKDFIKSSINAFLAGYSDDDRPTKPTLFAVLGLNTATYDQWLERSAQEIIYWTARQPDEWEEVDKEKRDANFDHDKDCFTHHIQQGWLSKDLYPEVGFATGSEIFHNNSNQRSLGVDHSTFPLVSLMNGLTKLCDYLISGGDKGNGGSTQTPPKGWVKV